MRDIKAPVAASGQVALASLSSTVVDFLFPGTAFCPVTPGNMPAAQEISKVVLHDAKVSHVSQPEPSTPSGLGGLGGLDLGPTRVCIPCCSGPALPCVHVPAGLSPGLSASGTPARHAAPAPPAGHSPPSFRGLGGLGPSGGSGLRCPGNALVRPGRTSPSFSVRPGCRNWLCTATCARRATCFAPSAAHALAGLAFVSGESRRACSTCTPKIIPDTPAAFVWLLWS